MGVCKNIKNICEWARTQTTPIVTIVSPNYRSTICAMNKIDDEIFLNVNILIKCEKK